MYLTTNELKQKHKERIDALKGWCKDHKQGAIPKLLQHASALGGIREDVLSFFEQYKECAISKDMHAAFEKLLVTNAQAGWYELTLRLGARGDVSTSQELMDETLSVMRAGMPLGLAAHALECSTVDEFIQIRHLHEQESMQDTIHSLKEDADYFRQIYKDAHFELDKISLELARARRENKRLEQRLRDLKKAHLYELDEEPDAKATQTQDTSDEELRIHVTQSKNAPDEENNVQMTQPQDLGDVHAEGIRNTNIQVFDSLSCKKKSKAIELFTGLVKKIRARRFAGKTQAEQKIEIAMAMAQNGYGPDRQRSVLDAMQEGHIPWDHIYSHVYDDAGDQDLGAPLSEPEEPLGVADGQSHGMLHDD